MYSSSGSATFAMRRFVASLISQDAQGNSASSADYMFTTLPAGLFTYATGGTAQLYYVPQGNENTLFGSGVVLQVMLTWSGSVMKLYLNNTLVKSSSYAATTPTWTAASNFDLGAYQYLNAGYYDLDDVIDEFTVTASPNN